MYVTSQKPYTVIHRVGSVAFYFCSLFMINPTAGKQQHPIVQCISEILLCFHMQDEALSPQSQLSPVSVCSDSSGFSVNSPPAKKAPKRNIQTTRGEASFSSYLYLHTLSQKQGKFCGALWGSWNSEIKSGIEIAAQVVSHEKGRTYLYLKKGNLPELKPASPKYLTISVSLSHSINPNLLTRTTSQTGSANQEAHPNWSEGFHPAKTTDYSCAAGSCCSPPAGQDNHHPAFADHHAACGQTSSCQHPTSTPCRSELALHHS